MADPRLDELCINTLRMLSMDMVQTAKSGHPGMPLGASPAAYVIWDRFLRHNPANPAWHDRDRFVLSAGHACTMLYALLHLTGYQDMPMEQLKSFRRVGSRTPGHPEAHLAAGVEATTGPLGQGIANAVGMAIAEAHLAALFNRPGHEIVNHRTFVICSDGDLMEGVSQEAASLAGFLGLGKLIVLYDDNGISIEGSTHELAYHEDTEARFRACGWQVLKVDDGDDVTSIEAAIREGLAETERPTLIWSHSHIGYGSPEQDHAKCHGEPFSDDAARKTKEFYAWPQDKPFHVPEEAAAHFRQALERGRDLEAEWQKRFQAYRRAYPDLAERFALMMDGRMPHGWEEALPTFSPDEGGLATRNASGAVLNALAKPLEGYLVGGSADLGPSTKTILSGFGHIGPHRFDGMNVHFGVREHAMGAILNGMAYHGGVIPFGATFLVFSDYMRPPMRIAAMTGLAVKYVFTHDSIGVGEDGPTHQPVEHLAALRAIPNFVLLRPADANETAAAWKVALERRAGPTALALSRQKLPILDPQKYPIFEGVPRGAYVISEAQSGPPQVILMASGSEVSLALEAQVRLAGEGIRARVVSMPSWELFEAQDAAYREQVLPAAVRARLAVEAGVRLGWERYVGDRGDVLCMSTFGASGPYKDVLKHFGFTAEAVAERAKAVLKRTGG